MERSRGRAGQAGTQASQFARSVMVMGLITRAEASMSSVLWAPEATRSSAQGSTTTAIVKREAAEFPLNFHQTHVSCAHKHPYMDLRRGVVK